MTSGGAKGFGKDMSTSLNIRKTTVVETWLEVVCSILGD